MSGDVHDGISSPAVKATYVAAGGPSTSTPEGQGTKRQGGTSGSIGGSTSARKPRVKTERTKAIAKNAAANYDFVQVALAHSSIRDCEDLDGLRRVLSEHTHWAASLDAIKERAKAEAAAELQDKLDQQ